MSSVLRIALAYFNMVPLQRWLNLAALVMFAGAGLMAAFGQEANGAKAVFILCTFGITLMLMVPGLGGGMAMRMASRPSIGHLRPHGRLRLLLGSALAMTLVAMLACLPTMAATAYLAAHDLPGTGRYGEPLEVFGFFWPVAALGWIILFTLSRTLMVGLAIPAIAIGAMQLPFLLQRFPAFTPVHLLELAAGAWVAFGMWYLRATRITPPMQQNSWMAGVSSYQWLLGSEDNQPGDSPDKAVACYLLGTSSHRVFVLTGIWTAAIFLAVSLLTPRGKGGQGSLLPFMLPFVAIQCAVMGFNTARRARALWLRKGMARDNLFSVAEKLGLKAAMLSWGIVAGAVALFLLITEPQHAATVLLFVAAQAVVACCLFYLGMALVRNWSASDVILCISAILLLVAQMFFAQPPAGLPPLQPVITLVVAVACVLPLRWYAHRRWLGLDWTLIKPPRLDWRRS